MTACVKQGLEALMRSAGPAHHDSHVEKDANDQRWATWYAEYLQQPICDLIGKSITRTDLVRLLLGAENERQWIDPHADWPSYYADYLVRRA